MLKESERKELVVEPGAPTSASAASSQPGSGPASTTEADSGWSGWRTAGVVVGAVGIAGLVVGTVFGLKASSKKSDSDGLCDANNLCTADGLSLRHDAGVAADVSTATFIVGGVLLAGGIVLLIDPFSGSESAADGEAPNPTVALDLGPGTLSVRGRW